MLLVVLNAGGGTSHALTTLACVHACARSYLQVRVEVAQVGELCRGELGSSPGERVHVVLDRVQAAQLQIHIRKSEARKNRGMMRLQTERAVADRHAEKQGEIKRGCRQATQLQAAGPTTPHSPRGKTRTRTCAGGPAAAE